MAKGVWRKYTGRLKVEPAICYFEFCCTLFCSSSHGGLSLKTLVSPYTETCNLGQFFIESIGASRYLTHPPGGQSSPQRRRLCSGNRLGACTVSATSFVGRGTTITTTTPSPTTCFTKSHCHRWCYWLPPVTSHHYLFLFALVADAVATDQHHLPHLLAPVRPSPSLPPSTTPIAPP